ncbi:MAG: DNA polymerase Y family protein, partial [Pseudomonadota bacterium]
SGCAHLFGGEAALISDLFQRFSEFGYVVRLAIADTPGAAWAVARSGAGLGKAGDDPKKAIVPVGQNRRFLAGLPITGLRLPGQMIVDLRRLGLHRIGDLSGLPRGSITKRFGKEVLLRLDQALGRQGEPISPHLPVIPHAARMAFAEPIGRAEDVTAALERLLQRLCKQLETAREGARQLVLKLYRVDGMVIERAVGTVRPVRDTVLLARLFAEKLDDIDAGFGIETIVLSAHVTEKLELSQNALTDQAALRTASAFADLVDRAVGRFGPGSVSRLSPRQSHLPERAVARLPVDGKTFKLPNEAWPAEWRRPVRLFAEPQPIEAVAPIPDDPPVLFRWQGVVHHVALAEGPERIAPEWWLDGPGNGAARPRDYYRVEDVAGRRFWLFRHGLYEGDEAAAPPAWFLHGLFG